MKFELMPQEELEQLADAQWDRDSHRSIDDLPQQLGDIITLRISRRRSYADIAQALHISEATVRRKLKEALDLLK